jgi:hypothetical protein
VYVHTHISYHIISYYVYIYHIYISNTNIHP